MLKGIIPELIEKITLTFGIALAKFHQFSKGLHYDDMPAWDIERVINPFQIQFC
jgi:hypothetical protein